MAEITSEEPIAGFEAPVHRSLTEPILLAGAPRAVAILNGTVSAALGLGLRLWIAGLVFWAIGHMAAVWAAKPVLRRGRAPARQGPSVQADRDGFPLGHLSGHPRRSQSSGYSLPLAHKRHHARQDRRHPVLTRIRRQWFAKRKSVGGDLAGGGDQ